MTLEEKIKIDLKKEFAELDKKLVLKRLEISRKKMDLIEFARLQILNSKENKQE